MPHAMSLAGGLAGGLAEHTLARSRDCRPSTAASRKQARRTASSRLGAVSDRSPLEMMGAAALAATEVSRAVRERGVSAFDDSKSFVARDESGTGEARSRRSLVHLPCAFYWFAFASQRACTVLLSPPQLTLTGCRAASTQVDKDGLPLAYDRKLIQSFWDKRPSELQARGLRPRNLRLALSLAHVLLARRTGPSFWASTCPSSPSWQQF